MFAPFRHHDLLLAQVTLVSSGHMVVDRASKVSLFISPITSRMPH